MKLRPIKINNPPTPVMENAKKKSRVSDLMWTSRIPLDDDDEIIKIEEIEAEKKS
jgi:hypothetical protein